MPRIRLQVVPLMKNLIVAPSAQPALRHMKEELKRLLSDSR